MKTHSFFRFFVLSIVTCVMFSFHTLAQQGVAINTSGAAADSSAMLDVSSTTRGMLVPRMTEIQRDAIANPAEGLLIFNTTSKCLDIYIMSTWQAIYCGCSGAPATPGAITGTTDVCSGQVYNYTINPVSGATTYSWTVPAGAVITSGQGTVSVTILFGSTSGNIGVTAGNYCGTSATGSQAVTVYLPVGNAGAISGPANVAQGQTGVVYSITPVTGASSYNWTVPAGATITSGQGSTSITVDFGTNSGNICVTPSSLYCGNGGSNCLTITVSTCPPGSQTFVYTGGLQTFSVPICVTSITVVALGAQGGGVVGGNGGRAEATIVVTPGEVLNVYVGGRPSLQMGPGGYNGGGAITALPCGGGSDGWPGGGASDVRRGLPLANRLIVAGGGGGMGWSSGVGGVGGGLTGGDGQPSWIAGTHGKGGTQSAGGIGGYYSGNGQAAPDGTLGTGGDGGPTSGYCIGGAGGGGYYGGGGGYVSAGGGGSSFVAYPGNTNTSTSSGVNAGNGLITINW